jgi:hypothetical protein
LPLPSVCREEGDAAVIDGVLDVTTKRVGFNECVRHSPRAVNSRSSEMFTECTYNHAKLRTKRRHWAGEGMRRLAARDARPPTAMMKVEKIPMVRLRHRKHGCSLCSILRSVLHLPVLAVLHVRQKACFCIPTVSCIVKALPVIDIFFESGSALPISFAMLCSPLHPLRLPIALV